MKISTTRTLSSRLGVLSGFSLSAAVATYGFLSIASRNLNTEDFGRFTMLWSGIYVVSGVLLGALEPEISRLVAVRAGREAKLTILLCTGLLGGILGILGAVSAMGKNPLDSHWQMGLLFPAAILTFMTVQVVIRGQLAGHGATMRYGIVAPMDAAFRLFALLVGFGSLGTSLSTVLAAMAAGSGLTVLVTWSFIMKRRDDSCLDDRPHEFQPQKFFHLIFATSGMTLLVSGIPLLASNLGHSDHKTLASIGAMSMVSRIPLLLVMGFESILTSEFSVRIADGQMTRSATLQLSMVGPLLGVLGGLVGALCGPEVVTLVAGPLRNVDRLSMTLMSSGAGLCLGSLLLAPLLIALRAHLQLSALWLTSAAVLGGIMIFTDGSTSSVALSFLLATLFAQTTMSGFAVSRVGRTLSI